MLPLTLLSLCAGNPILVELKSGETYNGTLSAIDNFMNLSLNNVILTSPDGQNFHRIPTSFIRGNNIKYLRVPQEVLDKAVQQRAQGNDRRKQQQ
jgi:U6 snRNA-associated Sm-like protein LSm4